jgi:hypothetical protein
LPGKNLRIVTKINQKISDRLKRRDCLIDERC